jgi:hypothetical protein
MAATSNIPDLLEKGLGVGMDGEISDSGATPNSPSRGKSATAPCAPSISLSKSHSGRCQLFKRFIACPDATNRRGERSSNEKMVSATAKNVRNAPRKINLQSSIENLGTEIKTQALYVDMPLCIYKH